MKRKERVGGERRLERRRGDGGCCHERRRETDPDTEMAAVGSARDRTRTAIVWSSWRRQTCSLEQQMVFNGSDHGCDESHCPIHPASEAGEGEREMGLTGGSLSTY
jgi:hypothetical protein